jgi:hypothetical protein
MIYSPSLSSRFLANRTLNVKNPLETKNSFVHAKQQKNRQLIKTIQSVKMQTLKSPNSFQFTSYSNDQKLLKTRTISRKT